MPPAVAVALVAGCQPTPSQVRPVTTPEVVAPPPVQPPEAASPEPAGPQPIHFTLAWPEGEAHVSRQMYKRRPETNLDRTFLCEWTMRVQKVDDGTRIESEGFQKIAFDGRLGNAFEVDPPEGFISEITVDDAGKIVEMGGLDQLRDVLETQEEFKAEAGAPRGWKANKLVAAFAADEALKRTQRNSWNAVGGDLVGREFVPGEVEVTETKAVHPLDPETESVMRTETRVTTEVPCGEDGPETCVRFRAFAEPEDPQALSRELAEGMRRHDGSDDELPAVSLAFEVKRILVLDPETMRPFVAEHHEAFSLRIARGEQEEETSVEQGVELRFEWE